MPRPFPPPETPCRTDMVARLLSTWTRWRGDRDLPRRQDVQLCDLKAELPHLFLLEAVDRDRLVIRVAGSWHRERLGFEPTGLNYFDLVPPEGREVRIARYRSILEHPCGGVFVNEHRTKLGGIFETESIGLPIAPDEPDGVWRIIGLVCDVAPPRADVVRLGPDGKPLKPSRTATLIDLGFGVPADPELVEAPSGLAAPPPALGRAARAGLLARIADGVRTLADARRGAA